MLSLRHGRGMYPRYTGTVVILVSRVSGTYGRG